jgi:predicted Rossmann fold flavoprotein
MNHSFDAVIIGGGACGLMCAVQAGYLGKRTLILEKNEKVGAKILISGGGRCNYTNLYASEANFISENLHFCKSALSQYTVEDTISFFESFGIEGQEKTLGQLFPESNNAKDIVRVFETLCADLDQKIITNAEVKEVQKLDSGEFKVSYFHNNKLKEVLVPSVVIASGGLPIAKMGATDFGLRVARQFGLKITETAPALVPLTITGKDAEWFAKLSGNSIFCRVSNDRISFEENILFTHWGLSGPAILQISSYWKAGEQIRIDLLPNQNISELIQSQRMQNGRKTLYSLLSDLYTKKFSEALDKYLPVEKNFFMEKQKNNQSPAKLNTLVILCMIELRRQSPLLVVVCPM